ncbi:MAG: signal recognition particle-docking protein FtsY [Candidatus Marinimicrobia bacterium]|nr:signal recognition particle-docking protein FtsY [Candidatus Neomarinimicrobiota bacterium]
MAGNFIIDGLKKTRKGVLEKVGNLFRIRKISDEDIEAIETALITSDVGIEITEQIIEKLKKDGFEKEVVLSDKIIRILKEMLPEMDSEFKKGAKPHVILVVGVNGTGKTTTIGKLANKYRKNGDRVLVVSADTFRAAAGEQLEIWAKRAGVDFFANPESNDPGSVVFDSLRRAKRKDYDIVLIDTAGRMHTRQNLMNELEKIKRVCGKVMEGAPHDVWLVVDASFGQNGVVQTEEFLSKIGLTGIILAKVDGTAKGGVAISIVKRYELPIKYVGFGESIESIAEFDLDDYLRGMFKPE